MPILHTQIGAQGKSPDGKVVQLPPAVALQMRGPVLQVTVTIEQNAGDLGLPVIDVGSMQSASHERHPCNVYPIQIVSPALTINVARSLGAALASQGLIVLIGRDVLQNCNLFYNGPAGQFTLSL